MHLFNRIIEIVAPLLGLGGFGYTLVRTRSKRREARITAAEQEQKTQAAAEQKKREVELETLLVLAEDGNRSVIDQFRRNDYKSYNGVLERDAKQWARFIEIVFRPLIVTWREGVTPKERFEAIKSLIQTLNAYNDSRKPVFYLAIREALELPGSLEVELSNAFEEYTDDLCTKAREGDKSAFFELLKIHRGNREGWNLRRLNLTYPTDWNDWIARWIDYPRYHDFNLPSTEYRSVLPAAIRDDAIRAADQGDLTGAKIALAYYDTFPTIHDALPGELICKLTRITQRHQGSDQPATNTAV